MTSIGTLFAFVVVCARRADPARQAARGASGRSACPFGPMFPVLGILSCALPDAEPAGAHLGAVPGVARHRHDHLLVLRPHAQPARERERSRRRARRCSRWPTSSTTLGLLLIFNAGCIAILGYMTEFGITTETTAKWATQIRLVTADQADTFGLKFLAVAIAVWVVGFGLTQGVGREVDSVDVAARRLGRRGVAPRRIRAELAPRIAAFRAAPRPAARAGRGARRRRTRPRRSTSATSSRRRRDAGCRAELFRLAADATLDDALGARRRLNADEAIDGILVQSPLPDGHGRRRRAARLRRRRSRQGRRRLSPAERRPAGAEAADAGGLHAARLHRAARARGHSDARAGTPSSSAAATSSASRWRCCCCIATRRSPSATRGPPDLPAVARRPTSWSPAIGRPGFVTPDFVKPGATVIDVGINTLTDARPTCRRLLSRRAAASARSSPRRAACWSATCIRRSKRWPAR